MALVSRPLKQRWSERTLRAAQGRMEGQDLLVSFGGAGHPGDCQKKLAQQGETRAISPLGKRPTIQAVCQTKT